VNLDPWSMALEAAVVFALDPKGLGGILVRARPGVVRETWMDHVRCLLDRLSFHKVPIHVSEERLLGGLDLAATLRSGSPVSESGLLARGHGGVLVVPMAERLAPSTVAHIGRALDVGEVCIEREGVRGRWPARWGVVALDEGIDEERAPDSLADRLAIHLDLSAVGPRDAWEPELPDVDWSSARGYLPRVDTSPAHRQSLCGAAWALGVASLRAPYLALRVARARAALDGRATVEEDDLACAARLVLGPRATRLPVAEPEPEAEPEAEPPPPEDGQEEGDVQPGGRLDDLVLAAAASAMPADVLASLSLERAARARSAASGTAGAEQKSMGRGRPIGVRAGRPRDGRRLNVVETLRAAAPWQSARGRQGRRVLVRPEDFRLVRTQRPTETTTIFCVDASGSAALQRLAEAKGAVERVLADCYVRRDQVALIAFRGETAELLLPPTRSLVRAKRCLAGLPGGGTTPLATGIDAALQLALDVRRRGPTPILVFMTDGRANVARDGTQGRGVASQDALAAARGVAVHQVPTLFVDTAPRSQPGPRQLAAAMHARYLALPYADPAGITDWVRARSEVGSDVG
jgi:magnesium chelatase subunit D